jgi:alpha-ketoglutarate-dependent taurine dioxygenase
VKEIFGEMNSNSVRFKRLSGGLGAEVAGIDLASAHGGNLFPAVHEAFLEHSVLVFHEQNLTPDQLVAFTRRFGRLEQHVIKDFALPENPDVFVVSNLKEAGKPIGAIRAGQYWHSDCSYMEKPTLASLLYALEIPSYGGDTMFTSTVRAYEELSDRMKDLLAGLKAVHDYTLAYEQYFAWFSDRPPLSPEQKAKVPPVVHPVVRTHPDTGKKVLFVNPGFTRHIVGMSEAESRAILGFLFEHTVQPHMMYRHRWSKGDLVIWDNRATWHLAVADYDMAEPRHMHRTSIQGDRPH